MQVKRYSFIYNKKIKLDLAVYLFRTFTFASVKSVVTCMHILTNTVP